MAIVGETFALGLLLLLLEDGVGVVVEGGGGVDEEVVEGGLLLLFADDGDDVVACITLSDVGGVTADTYAPLGLVELGKVCGMFCVCVCLFGSLSFSSSS